MWENMMAKKKNNLYNLSLLEERTGQVCVIGGRNHNIIFAIVYRKEMGTKGDSVVS